MAIFQLDIADADVQRVFDAVCGNYGRPDDIVNPEYIVELDEEGNEIDPVDAEGNPIPEMVENPESKGAFTHRMVRKFLEDHVGAWEREQAKKAAAEAVNATVTLSDPEPDTE